MKQIKYNIFDCFILLESNKAVVFPSFLFLGAYIAMLIWLCYLAICLISLDKLEGNDTTGEFFLTFLFAENKWVAGLFEKLKRARWKPIKKKRNETNSNKLQKNCQ